jgi:hypothetical protein
MRMMRGQPGFFDLDELYQRLSAVGAPLEKLNAIIPWSVFENSLAKALYNLSNQQADLVIEGRPSFVRFDNPASVHVHFGRGQAILLDRERIERDSIRQRPLNRHAKAALFNAQTEPVTSLFQGPRNLTSFDDGGHVYTGDTSRTADKVMDRNVKPSSREASCLRSAPRTKPAATGCMHDKHVA